MKGHYDKYNNRRIYIKKFDSYRWHLLLSYLTVKYNSYSYSIDVKLNKWWFRAWNVKSVDIET